MKGIVNFLFPGGACSVFLQFRLGCHGLPIATGRLAGAGHMHVDKANRVCWLATVVLLAMKCIMVLECTALAPLRQQHADLFTPHTDTMRSFFAQQDHLAHGGLELRYRLSEFHAYMTSLP